MRETVVTIAFLVAAGLAPPATAQEPEGHSADEYECLLAGTCAQPTLPAQPGAARRMPSAQRGFVLIRPRAELRLSFQSGSARLTGAALAEARKIATALKRPTLAAKRFRIEGHTDSAGSRAYNLQLSRRRAEAVKAELVRLGVAGNRLEAKGYGFGQPLPGTAASDPANRRVEAVAIP